MIREIISMAKLMSNVKDNVPVKKCGWCGNEDSNYFFEEDETIYCQKCHKRTRKDTGKADAIICPYCGKLKDRLAYQCPECGR